jgi:hypothetical protein
MRAVQQPSYLSFNDHDHAHGRDRDRDHGHDGHYHGYDHDALHDSCDCDCSHHDVYDPFSNSYAMGAYGHDDYFEYYSVCFSLFTKFYCKNDRAYVSDFLSDCKYQSVYAIFPN